MINDTIKAAIREYELGPTKKAKILKRNINKAIKADRVRNRMTQRQFSAALGISLPYLSDIERFRAGISDEVLEKLKKLK